MVAMIENSTPSTMNLLLLPTFFFILSFNSLTSQSQHISAKFCDELIVNDPALLTNINTVVPKLVSAAAKTGFATASSGDGEDKIYGLAQCRGDIPHYNCSSCIKQLANEIQNLCPNYADARVWHDRCFMRYTIKKFYGVADTTGAYFHSMGNVSDPAVFERKLAALMARISAEAVKKGMGKGKREIDELNRIYGLVQCTGDLSEMSCAQCLAVAVSNIPRFCEHKRGCRVFYSSCYVGYELHPFFFPARLVM